MRLARAGGWFLSLWGVALLTVHAAPPAAPQGARRDPLYEFRFLSDSRDLLTVPGRIHVTAQDGGLLIEGRDGRLWTIEPSQLQSRKELKGPFLPAAEQELSRLLPAELGADFQVYTTRHYVLCYRTSREYAHWCGALFERLHAGFYNFWKQRGWELPESEFPLIAVILPDAASFSAFATRDAGAEYANAQGYYRIATNRMVLFDQTSSGGKPARSIAEIQRRIETAPRNIATIVHEATHQIAFNSGLHTRYADNPLWLTEGMAMYFETPDVQSRSGWKTIGAVNPLRLQPFRASLSRRPADSLRTMLQSDARFTAAESMGEAYAEAWAFSYFLIRTRKEAYTNYVRAIGKKPMLKWGTPTERLAEFQQFFGPDLAKLDSEFLKFIRTLK